MAVLNRVQLIEKQAPCHPCQGLILVPGQYALLATNESYKKNEQWETLTEWHNLVFFGKLASQAQRLQKGSLVYIEGKLRSNSWVDKEGVTRQSISIVVQAMQLLDNVKPEEADIQKPEAEEYLSQMHAMLDEDNVPF